jgi:formate dehydrogenase subunit delta
MSADKLIYMANQIGKFFAAQGRHDENLAVAGIETHLRKFWDPRMRREIVARVRAGEAPALDPLPRRAVERLAAEGGSDVWTIDSPSAES